MLENELIQMRYNGGIKTNGILHEHNNLNSNGIHVLLDVHTILDQFDDS